MRAPRHEVNSPTEVSSAICVLVILGTSIAIVR